MQLPRSTHPRIFFLRVFACVTTCGRPCAHALLPGAGGGSAEARRWQVDPYQSPLSLQGSNCSRPQTFTLTPPCEKKILRLPSPFTQEQLEDQAVSRAVSVWFGLLNSWTVDGVGLLEICMCMTTHDALCSKVHPDCFSCLKHSWRLESCSASIILTFWKLYKRLYTKKHLYDSSTTTCWISAQRY